MKIALTILSSLIFSNTFACLKYEALIIADVNQKVQQENDCLVTVKAITYYAPSSLCAFVSEARLFSEGTLIRNTSCSDVSSPISGVIVETSETEPLELE